MPKAPSSLCGPEPIRPAHFDSLLDLVDRTFRTGTGRSMLTDYPFFFRRENFPNMFVYRDGERVVSHIGILPVTVSVFGHPLRVGLLGNVGTHPDYRGRGLATNLLLHVYDRWRAQGGQLMMISGGRGLYLRNGARQVGACEQFLLEPAARASGDVSVEVCGPQHAPLLSALHRRKPLRFLRPLEEWRLNIEVRCCQGHPCDYYLVRRGKEPTAYFALGQHPENDDGLCTMQEYGGRMADIIAALPGPAREVGCKKTWWRLYPHETEARADLLAAGATSQGAGPVVGVARVIDFVALMEALRGYFAELVGEQAAGGLEFEERAGETFLLRCGAAEVTVSGHAALVELLFGGGLANLPKEKEPTALRGVLGQILPLPIAQYDMNYA